MKSTKLEYNLIKEENTKDKNVEILSHIKSKHILKDIFFYINNKEKLKLINYNKKIQKLIEVDINDYMKTSRKCRKVLKNGKGLEFELNTNQWIFKGEYLNGKRNGKGKEYYHNNKLLFEGEYINGKRNGKGKEYYYDDKLKFEGEYINGERNGKGKEYYDCGKLKFEGEYLNGERNGKGKEYYYDGKLKFEGEYLNGKRNE